MLKINWLQLDVNILDDAKIKMIRKHPAGSDLFVMWIGLLCMGMKSEQMGYVYISDGIPYSDEELAQVLGLDTKTVQMGIQVFEKYGMIKMMKGGLIELVKFKKHQNIDYLNMKREENRLKVARFREKQKGIKQEILEIEDTLVTVTGGTVHLHRKGKERKEKKQYMLCFADCVFLLFSEYKKFRKYHSKEDMRWMLNKLASYKQASGRTYKNDAAAIRTWVEDALLKRPATQANIQQKRPAPTLEEIEQKYGRKNI